MIEGFDDVLARARKGSGDAFATIWTDLSRPVAAFLRSRGADDPDDLTSEVFLSVFTGLDRFRGDQDDFRSWVFTIAHRRSVDAWRRRARTVAVAPLADDEDGGSVPSAEDGALETLSRERVLAVLGTLTDDQREVLTLRIVADLTVEQVAAVMDRQVGAVKALQRRGLASVRRAIERQGVPL